MAAENKTKWNEEVKTKWKENEARPKMEDEKKLVTAFVENSPFFLSCIFQCLLQENTAADLTFVTQFITYPYDHK